MSGLDLYALPSHSENFGITIIEALSLKVPVMISKKVNIFREIKKNNCGIIVETNPSSISKGINKLIFNSSEIKKMQNNSIKLIKSKYCWSRITPKFIEMYKSSQLIKN